MYFRKPVREILCGVNIEWSEAKKKPEREKKRHWKEKLFGIDEEVKRRKKSDTTTFKVNWYKKR